MSKNIAEIFNLQGLKVINTVVSEQEIIIKVRLKKEHVKCSHCGRRSTNCHSKNGMRRIKHQYWGRKTVILEGYLIRW
jgi:transposase